MGDFLLWGKNRGIVGGIKHSTVFLYGLYLITIAIFTKEKANPL